MKPQDIWTEKTFQTFTHYTPSTGNKLWINKEIPVYNFTNVTQDELNYCKLCLGQSLLY